MLENLESSYNCSNAGNDLHQLQEELNSLSTNANGNQEIQDHINRLENQIQFIKNKCDIRP